MIFIIVLFIKLDEECSHEEAVLWYALHSGILVSKVYCMRSLSFSSLLLSPDLGEAKRPPFQYTAGACEVSRIPSVWFRLERSVREKLYAAFH